MCSHYLDEILEHYTFYGILCLNLLIFPSIKTLNKVLFKKRLVFMAVNYSLSTDRTQTSTETLGANTLFWHNKKLTRVNSQLLWCRWGFYWPHSSTLHRPLSSSLVCVLSRYASLWPRSFYNGRMSKYILPMWNRADWSPFDTLYLPTQFRQPTSQIKTPPTFQSIDCRNWR